MWAGALARGARWLIQTQIALRRFDNWQRRFRIDDRIATAIVDLHHLNILVRAIVGASRTANARRVIDGDVS